MNGNADPFQEQQPQVAAQLAQLQRKVQHYLDKTTPFIAYRWLALAAVTLTYALRVYYLRGFYIVTYALGIYNLNLLLGFLSPQIDPELEAPTLPSKRDDEFQPFMRRLPEYKFWYVVDVCVWILVYQHHTQAVVHEVAAAWHGCHVFPGV